MRATWRLPRYIRACIDGPRTKPIRGRSREVEHSGKPQAEIRGPKKEIVHLIVMSRTTSDFNVVSDAHLSAHRPRLDADGNVSLTCLCHLDAHLLVNNHNSCKSHFVAPKSTLLPHRPLSRLGSQHGSQPPLQSFLSLRRQLVCLRLVCQIRRLLHERPVPQQKRLSSRKSEARELRF